MCTKIKWHAALLICAKYLYKYERKAPFDWSLKALPDVSAPGHLLLNKSLDFKIDRRWQFPYLKSSPREFVIRFLFWEKWTSYLKMHTISSTKCILNELKACETVFSVRFLSLPFQSFQRDSSDQRNKFLDSFRKLLFSRCSDSLEILQLLTFFNELQKRLIWKSLMYLKWAESMSTSRGSNQYRISRWIENYTNLSIIVDQSERSEWRSTVYISLGGISALIFVKRVDPIELQQSQQQPISCMKELFWMHGGKILKQKAKRFEIKNKV